MNGQATLSRSRAFSLRLYLLIVFGLSWPFQIASVIWGGGNLLPVYILNSAAMLMVTVGTYIAGRYVFREGFTGAGWNWGKPRYYVAVIGLALLLWIVPTTFDVALRAVPPPQRPTPVQIAWVFVLLFGTVIPGFGEEFGWRGYMLPRLTQRYSVRKAIFIHAVIWWAWHLPVLVEGTIETTLATSPHTPIWGMLIGAAAFTAIVSAIPTILHGVVFAYIWTRGQSLAVSSVYHAAFDGMRDSLGATVGIGPTASIWANLLLIVLGAVLLWRGNWKNLIIFRSLQ